MPRFPRRPEATNDAEAGPLAFPPFTRPRRVRAELVAGILRSGRSVPDETFDEIFPDAVRRASPAHWTPIPVCARVVELLRLRPEDRLLDVGAGAGKFCIVAAAMSGARVHGVERQPELVQVAREAARRLGVDVVIDEGTFDARDSERFDAAYFFNPFTETILLPGARDFAADHFAGRAAEDIVRAERFLEAARVGMRVVTFYGFGGSMPSDYEKLAQESWEGGLVELWKKRAVEAASR